MHRDYSTQTRKQQNNKCPHCGWQFASNFNFEQMIAGLAPGDVNGDFTAYRSTPTRTATIEADLLVPAGQALISALVTALPTAAIGMWFRWQWYAPLAVASITILVQWFRYLNHQERGQAMLEEFSYSPGPPKPSPNARQGNPTPIRLDIYSRDDDHRAAIKIVDLPSNVSGEDFKVLCQDVLAGKSLARSNWAGSGKLLSRDEYDGLMSAMTDAGLIVTWPGAGKRLTNGGRHAIRRMIREG